MLNPQLHEVNVQNDEPRIEPYIGRWSERPIAEYKPQSLIMKATVLAGIRVLIALDFKHTYHGPIKGSEMSKELLAKIIEFRNSVYKDQCPYLQSERQLKIDEDFRLDARSTHFYATDRSGKIVGCLRYTERPYEIEGLTEELSGVASDYEDYLEISRYIALKSAPFVSERLLFFSGSWIWTQTRYRGMIAFCREKLKEHYRRYGVTDDYIDGPFFVKWRQPKPYFIVTADFDQIGSFIREKYLLGNLSWKSKKA